MRREYEFHRFGHPEAYLARLHSGDDCGIDEGLGPFGRVFDEALPLARKPHELLLLLIKVSVHTVLKVGRS